MAQLPSLRRHTAPGPRALVAALDTPSPLWATPRALLFFPRFRDSGWGLPVLQALAGWPVVSEPSCPPDTCFINCVLFSSGRSSAASPRSLQSAINREEC